jgi:hypothetical protein
MVGNTPIESSYAESFDEPEEIIDNSWDAELGEVEEAPPPIPQKNGSRAVPREVDIPVISDKFLVSEQLADNEFHAKMIINLLMIDGSEIEAGKQRIALYNEWRKQEEYSRNDGPSRQKAAQKAIAGERPN